MEGRTLLFVRVVYFLLIPAVVVGSIASGGLLEGAGLLLVAVVSLVLAPKDRRDRILGRRDGSRPGVP